MCHAKRESGTGVVQLSEISLTHQKHCDVIEEEESGAVKSKTEIIRHRFPTSFFLKFSKIT